ncbi:MAG: signal peptidase II [Anaerolineaceae bacterium]|nr:signal peptidase II [Anaerolineaceae bacterium]
MKKALKSYSVLIPTAGVLIALDQWTKAIVRQNLNLGEMWMPLDWLSPYARIVHWYNTGVAFGMFRDKNLLFSILALAISVFLIIFYPKLTEEDWFLRIALGMQLGGSLGNLIDRVTIGHVTDFISVGNFPVFNFADASISVGVVVMILGLWIEDRKENQKKKALENMSDTPKQVND